MATRSLFVGREGERTRLADALDKAELGHGSVLLVSGDAGVGKTHLVQAVAEDSDALVLEARATQGAAIPYGGIVAALRAYLRACPDGLGEPGPLRQHLAPILPELGTPAAVSDRATLFEAVHDAFATLSRDRPVLLVLDDLHWSDEATLELLGALAEPVSRLSMLLVGVYRSEGLPRDHMLRRLRHELRRGGRLEELALGPLDAPESAELLEHVLDAAPAPSLVAAIHDRTQGVPFFVEELARALLVTEAVVPGPRGLALSEDGEVPLPDTIRDAVLVGASELSDDARAAAEVAATAGETFDLDVLVEIAGEVGLAELLECGLVVEAGPGRGAFRHALAREALYADVPWLRRKSLHARLAAELEARGAPSIEIATQWQGAGEGARAREALLRAAEESRAVHAYRDAAHAGRQALDLWPEDEDGDRRIEALDSYARSAELAGELAEAGRAWREVAAIRTERGTPGQQADAQRRLAAIHDLKGDRDAAVAARSVAAEAYAAAGKPAEAAVERLALGNYLRASASYAAAVELARAAQEEAMLADRVDLRIRALGLEGVARAKGGEHEAGLETVRSGLALALEHDLTPVAAELYQRLSLVLYDSADYRGAKKMLDSALALCRIGEGDGATDVACVTCLVYVLRECGEWQEALKLGRELISDDTAVWVAEGLIGGIHCYQGKLSSARRLLSSSYAMASRVGHFNMSVDTTAGLARVAAAEGADDEAADRCRSLLARWERSEDHHYAVKGLRWAAAFFSRRDVPDAAHACTTALTRIAADTGHGDAIAALAHAIGEVALADGDAGTAAEQLVHAVELHRSLDLPFERAEIGLRAGVALADAGEREPALERLADAYRTARKLGARPLAAEAAREVASLGESVAEHLGRRAAGEAGAAGLTPRELEVVRLVAVGRTNREIAQELFLSARTVDMHVRNILRKLDCRSRVAAAHIAGELGLLV
jgi:DNA-binding CsgD family transcriptional regulator/Cdc6-like AAA superfamily ATPase